MKTLALTLLAASQPIMVWSLIAIFLVAAFVYRVVDDIATVKKIDSSLKTKAMMKTVEHHDENQQIA